MPVEYPNVGVGDPGTSSAYSHLDHRDQHQFYCDVSFPREQLENNGRGEELFPEPQGEWWILHHTAGNSVTIDGATNQ